jgi:multiple sugar transport system substrate-binding protein
MEEGSGSNEGDCACATCPQDIIIQLDSEFMDFLEPHATNYQVLNPHIRIQLQEVDGGAAALQQRLIEGKPENRWDGAVFPAQNVGLFVEAGALWDMSDFVRQSETLQWPNVLPFFRHQMARYDDSIRMIPLDGDFLTMFYRRDLFEEHGIQVPRTWNEYIDAAKYFHGKPLGRHGSLISGSCVARAEECANEYWTSLILASMTQTRGTSSGFFLDPENLDPLFGEAMDASLEILAEQFKFGHTDELRGGCLESNYAFNEGKCALTYNWGGQITVSRNSYDVGVAPTPGSVAVLDRATDTLERCTEETCPHGIYYEDIGFVNHAPYSAFGGWAAGVSNASSEGRQHAAADFFAFVSNSQQSLGDVLPNERSLFAQPYRYPHVTSSNWIEAGFDEELAWQFTSSIRGISSENSVLEMRMPIASTFRQILDEEVTDYLDRLDLSGDNSALRQEVTSLLDQRIRNVISGAEDNLEVPLLDSYRKSIGFTETNQANMDNLIDEDYRNAAWGLSGLICLTTVCVMVWIIRYRNNQVMKAFQPFLLMQSAVGLFLLAATVIPLGFDDSYFSEDVLNITCMLIPWMYVTGFTIFFSSVYCKIRKCTRIYSQPSKHDVVMVEPSSAMRLNLRIFVMNGVVLVAWTLADPLTWVRSEVEGGIVLEDGTVETYGVCTGGSWASYAFGLILFFMNVLLCCIATYQAFSCRFLVLEYNEMQWLPLSLFPFIEVWLIGAPIIPLIYDNPTLLFVVISATITASTISVGLAVFAPKDWYIRKYKISKQGKNKQVIERQSSAGILVLKHPTVSDGCDQ